MRGGAKREMSQQVLEHPVWASQIGTITVDLFGQLLPRIAR